MPPQSEGYSKQRRHIPRSCREAEMCCQGQNNTCFVFGQTLDRSRDSRRCFCDSNCLILGDCCTDYHHTCKSADCRVAEWGEWTPCDNPCGFGTRKRQRDITQYPDNGGNHCPELKQRRSCVGYEAQVCRDNLVDERLQETRETARLLPIQFGRYRTMQKYDPWRGILKNLYERYFNEIFSRPTYSGQFTILSTHPGCEKSSWTRALAVNRSICVECQPVAMTRDLGMRCQGHGVYSTATSWRVMDVQQCHGTWELSQGHTPDVCSSRFKEEDIFIFI
ncbi:hypothetical protein BsWGS_21599 [Bradybaena similaris]